MVVFAFNLGEFKGDNFAFAWNKYLLVEQVVDSRTFLTKLSK